MRQLLFFGGLLFAFPELLQASASLDGAWQLKQYELDGKDVPVSGTLVFSGDHFAMAYRMGAAADSGRGHGGTYRVEGDRLLFSIPFWLQYVDGVSRVMSEPSDAGSRFEISGDELRIRFENEAVQRFTRAPSSKSPLDGSWKMADYESEAKTGNAAGLALFEAGSFVLIYTMAEGGEAPDARTHAGAFRIEGDTLTLKVESSIHCVKGAGRVERTPSPRDVSFRLAEGKLESRVRKRRSDELHRFPMKLPRGSALLPVAVLVSRLLHGAPEARIPEGASSFAYRDLGGVGSGAPMTVWTYRPPNLDPDAKIVFVLHGANRDAKRYRDQWQPHAESRDFLLAAPEFDAGNFSEDEYQRGNLADADGRASETSRWTFHAIERLFDVVRAAAGLRTARYSLYGHSAGAQFVHRFVLFMPEARYERAIAANAGWYTMPTFETSFPYGLAATLVTEAPLKRVMGRDLVVLLGEDDTDTNDPDLRATERARAQGATRVARGENFYRTALAAAARLGVSLRWQRIVVRGAGHSNQDMAEAAVAILVP